ncbi:MAG: hypothetical protein IT323_15375 [Anaerolineae bacterium]|nr:hypothetical protein [Anaerolineae bacterium]
MSGVRAALRDTLGYYAPWLAALPFVLVVIGGALLVGLLAGKIEFVGLAVAGVVLVSALIIILGYRFWWWSLAFLLFGYLLGSRGFAGIGVSPFYIGEGVLAIGILTLALAPFTRGIRVYYRRLFRIEILLLAVFLAIQVWQTIPYVGAYQVNAIRDAMTYAYSLFMLLILLLIPKSRVEWFFRAFGKVIPYALVWYPIIVFVSRQKVFNFVLPLMDQPPLYTKSSDIAVHVAGMGAFLLLQLAGQNQQWTRPGHWLVWALWTINAILTSAVGRAALLCNAAMVAIVAGLLPTKTRLDRLLLILGALGCLLILTGGYSTIKIPLGHRTLSIEQLVANVTSIVGQGDNSEGGVEGTKQWRLNWWAKIIDYTYHGPYFWGGKGYGINLSLSDGFAVTNTDALRSPHNGHMTILARSGVPGFFAWLLFLISAAIRLAREGYVRRNTRPGEAKVAAWLLAYLAAFMIMTAFDVFLEGPPGGPWFWALFGMAFVYFSKDDDAPRPAPTTPTRRGRRAISRRSSEPGWAGADGI